MRHDLSPVSPAPGATIGDLTRPPCLAVDPAKERLFFCVNTPDRPRGCVETVGAPPVVAPSLHFGCLSWVTQAPMVVELLRNVSTVWCEAQWIGADASKWSGVEPLCQTAGALRVLCTLAGRPLYFAAPSEWRGVLAPAPVRVRATARRVEQACAERLLGCKVNTADWPDYAAALGIWLHAQELGYRELGVNPLEGVP